jgi:hypothetical protein
MTALGMAVLGLVLLAWGAYLYRSPNLLERVRHQPLGRSNLFQILLELIMLGTFPEGLTLVVAGSAQALGADGVGLFAYIVGNLTVLALWLTRPNWAKPHWMRDATAELPS